LLFSRQITEILQNRNGYRFSGLFLFWWGGRRWLLSLPRLLRCSACSRSRFVPVRRFRFIAQRELDISEFVTKEQVDEIVDFFSERNTESLAEAKAHLVSGFCRCSWGQFRDYRTGGLSPGNFGSQVGFRAPLPRCGSHFRFLAHI